MHNYKYKKVGELYGMCIPKKVMDGNTGSDLAISSKELDGPKTAGMEVYQ